MNAELKIPMAEWKSLAAAFVFEVIFLLLLGTAAIWLIEEL